MPSSASPASSPGAARPAACGPATPDTSHARFTQRHCAAPLNRSAQRTQSRNTAADSTTVNCNTRSRTVPQSVLRSAPRTVLHGTQRTVRTPTHCVQHSVLLCSTEGTKQTVYLHHRHLPPPWQRLRPALVLVLVLRAAQDVTSRTAVSIIPFNGISVNGISFNGISFNESLESLEGQGASRTIVSAEARALYAYAPRVYARVLLVRLLFVVCVCLRLACRCAYTGGLATHLKQPAAVAKPEAVVAVLIGVLALVLTRRVLAPACGS